MHRNIVSLLIAILAAALFLTSGALSGRLVHERDAVQPGARMELSDAPPLLSLTIGALGGFRGLVADLLWLRVSYLQARGEYFEIVQLADWITHLRPRSSAVWAFHAWNMSYNISAMMPDPDDRWRWVVNGIKLLRDEGLRNNGRDPDMYAALAGMYMFKLGGLHEPGHPDYQRRFAEEMTALLGGPSPDYPALESDPVRRARLVEKYKLDPEVMKLLDDKYGPLDWRLAQTHAIYWAWMGRAYEKNPESLQCDRFIFQGMTQLFLHGKLLWQPERGAFWSGPNPALLPKVIGVYEDMLARHDNATIRTSFANFLRQAVVMLQGMDREQAMATFDLLRRKFPSPDTARGYDAFVSTYGSKLKGRP